MATEHTELIKWHYTKERSPSIHDCHQCAHGDVIAKSQSGKVAMVHWSTCANNPTEYYAWARVPSDAPPKKTTWRAPKIEDLLQAKEPIPCQVRDSAMQEWANAKLISIGLGGVFHCQTYTWKQCRIEVECD